MSEPGYYRYPTIHAETVVFSCEDDLWIVSASGGIARRLTARHGECSMPRLSPDGQWVAFVGRDEGHPEVFVIPAKGGESKRLTYLGGETCTVCGWSRDGSEVIFVSEAKSAFFRHTEAFAVGLSGGLPRPLNIGHVQSVAFGEKNASVIGRNNNDPARWKRYRGGTAGEIWIDAAGNSKFSRLITIDGNLVLPMWLDKRVYFLSDHGGVGNIYSCLPDGTDLKQHTNHRDYFVRFPSTDGERIVYCAGGDLFIFDPAVGKSHKVEISSPPTTVQVSRRFVEARENLEHFSPHPKGHSVGIIARGQPLTLGNWEGAVVQHGGGSRVRYRCIEWLPDGERFVVVSDSAGYERLELHSVNQAKEPVVITNSDIGRVVELKVSAASDMVAISNHRHELYTVNLSSKKSHAIDKSRCERIADLAWSPDGRWLAYSFSPRPETTIIRIADVDSGKVFDATRELRRDFSPAWDPDGNYLYLLAARDFFPVYDTLQFDLGFPTSIRPCLVTLRKDVTSPFVQQPRPIVKKQESHKKEKEAESSDADGKASVKKTKGKPKPIEIDFDGIEGRLLAFPINEGRYNQLVATSGRVLVTLLPVKGIKPNDHSWYVDGGEQGTLLSYDFEEQRLVTVQKEVGKIRMAFDQQTVIYRSKEKLRAIDAMAPLPSEGSQPTAPSGTGRKSGWIDLGRAQTLVQPQQEWLQMYEESWRLQKEHFWNEEMSDVDWKLVHDRYASLVKRVRTRSELSDIIWEMHGELGTSHAYEVGGDYRSFPAYYRGFLGADFVWDEKKGGFRVEKILRGDSWDNDAESPLAMPGVNVHEGDVIVSVNGRAVSRELTLDELLVNHAGREVALTVLVGKSDRRQVTVKTLKSERLLRYRHWVNQNRELVHKKTDGQVGYVHIPDMGPYGFAEFHRGYLTEYNHDGLIIDARYNRGGHVSALLLEKLNRKRIGYDISRWGTPQPYPPESTAGPMVCLTNQFAGSDGDIFSHCFKLYKLGPLVGKRTWGGVIGIWPRHRLVDGTVTTQPEFSFWFADVGWKVENYGTDPDFDVDVAPQDYKDGRDPQMEKALELIMKALAEKPVKLPDFSKRPSLPLPTQSEPALTTSGKRKSK